MNTTVVNIKRGEECDVYIGRAGQGQSGYFGNPIRLEPKATPSWSVCIMCGAWHRKRGDVLACYRDYLHTRVERDQSFRAAILGLRGKRLGCFCKPFPCHGDVIVEWLENHLE